MGESSRYPTPEQRAAEAKRLLRRDINFLKGYGLDLSDVEPEKLSDEVFNARIEKLPEENQTILRRIWERQRECRESWRTAIQSNT